MGNQDVEKFSDPQAKKKFTKYLLSDIQALEIMLNEGMIEAGITRIGAEQELCLVNKFFDPADNNIEILEAINDPHFVPEIAQFNIEANLDPLDFDEDCFIKMELQLRELMSKAHYATEQSDTKIVMTGILPTLQKEHLQFNFMTPNPRYKALDETIKEERGSHFELNITGVDELITNHDNILFEACNTSFQIHMQISPEEFTEKYNWSQMIAGPILAVTTNSPLLLGKRLWEETRISLFQQSVDTRTSSNIKREKEPRVTFGNQWLTGTVVDLYKDNISRFNPLFASLEMEDAMEILEKGGVPELEALKMHNSTVYKWNRACYGVGGGKPHLRIENRYVPSGPTIKDEMANTALWLGVMYGMPEEYRDLPNLVKFESCRHNFYNAARNGLDCQFTWFDDTVNATDLIRDKILPLARKGLKSAGISQKSIDELLGIIEGRIKNRQNGSKWMRQNFTALLDTSTISEASRSITEAAYNNQMSSLPVHEWPPIDLSQIKTESRYSRVRDIMKTETYTAKEDDIIELAINMMEWKKIQSIPVENNKNELVGLLTERELLKHLTTPHNQKCETIGELMNQNFFSISPGASNVELVDLFANQGASCVLVTEGNFLIGIVGKKDIIKVAHTKNIFK